MNYRPREKRSFTRIPRPTGPEWLSLNGIQLWLPREKREHFRPPASVLNLKSDGPEWAKVRSAFNFILQCSHHESLDYKIDWITKIGEGLSKKAYRADVTIFRNEGKQYTSFAVSQVLFDADPDAGSRMIKEQFILDSIGKKIAHFSVPEPAGMIWYEGKLISATSFIAGLPVELRAARSPIEHPWEVVGTVAAEIHKIAIHNLPQCLDRYPTRQDQAIAGAKNFKKYDVSEIQDALKWINENLPPKGGSVLVHGDLLGQNILRTLSEELFVIDWEYARVGDPAYDLAIVTRGSKKPFQVSGGLDRLIDSYLSSGGQELSKKDVHVYELLLSLGWYEQSLDRGGGGHSSDYYLDLMRNLLRRVAR